MGRWRARAAWARWIAALGVAGLSACAPSTPGPAEQPLSSHAIESVQLAELMRGLERLSRERLPQAMDLEQERTRRLYKIARVASAIAESAAQLEDAIAEVPLAPEERRAFAEHAEALRRGARRLAKDAHHLPPEAIRAEAAAVEATCAGCHQRFRIPGGRGE